MASPVGYQEYKIGGLTVQFPCKPYPSQFSMMDKIIKGLERSQHCLLESPTGSGKSLALLCSALAWQRAEIAKRDREEERKQNLLDEANSGQLSCCCRCHSDLKPETVSSVGESELGKKSTYFTTSEQTSTPATQSIREGLRFDHEDEDDDFKDTAKSFRTPGSNQSSLSTKLRKHICIEYEDTPTKPGSVIIVKTEVNTASVKTVNMISPESSSCDACECGSLGKDKKRKIPKIYFGTRTHKQIAQIVRELKRTAYHDVNMTILGSREHTCIHPEVSRSAQKNDGCKELLKGPGCRMKDRAKGFSSQAGVQLLGLTTAWDLEDMVKACKKKKTCPYFLTRALKEQCEIVICPYNYLVDPIIRDTMEINLKGQIVILDEAHNIEDSAREAGGQTLHQDVMGKGLTELLAMVNGGVDVAESMTVERVLRGLDKFINDYADKLEQKDFDSSCKIWYGFDIVAHLKRMGIGPSDFDLVQKAFHTLTEEKEQVVRNHLGEELKLSPPVSALIEKLLVVLRYLYKADMKYVEDYRLSILKATTFVTEYATNGSWLNPRHRHGGQRRVPVVACTLNFWCMNPAVAFSDFQSCRTVVLSSGTLSPTSSFSSELGMTFNIQLEANHVIKDNQVWVGAIGQGPNGTSLQAVYRNVETYGFQDELGRLVLQVCKTVPHGVLCFFPSYNCLDKLSKRWKTTGLWDQLFDLKQIVAEPRGSDKTNFEELMQIFYSAVRDSNSCSDQDGALFLAVCRGKVSEGLDFADNFARAVITVGIPYPNFKDIQVELKRKYNDQYRAARGLLSGSEWYEIQAYRALNQALGRCIRHKKDWGALILVDDRFVKNPQKYHKGLSKWVRNKTVPYQTFHSAMDSLAAFTQERIENMETEISENSFLPSTPCTPTVTCDTPRTPLQDLNTSLSADNRLNRSQMSADTPVAMTPDLGLRARTKRLSAESDSNVLPQSGLGARAGAPSTKSQYGELQVIDLTESQKAASMASQTSLLAANAAFPGKKFVVVSQSPSAVGVQSPTVLRVQTPQSSLGQANIPVQTQQIQSGVSIFRNPTQTPVYIRTPGQTPNIFGVPGQTPTIIRTSGVNPTIIGTPGQIPMFIRTPGQTPTIFGTPGQTPTIFGTPGQIPTIIRTSGQNPNIFQGISMLQNGLTIRNSNGQNIVYQAPKLQSLLHPQVQGQTVLLQTQGQHPTVLNIDGQTLSAAPNGNLQQSISSQESSPSICVGTPQQKQVFVRTAPGELAQPPSQINGTVSEHSAVPNSVSQSSTKQAKTTQVVIKFENNTAKGGNPHCSLNTVTDVSSDAGKECVQTKLETDSDSKEQEGNVNKKSEPKPRNRFFKFCKVPANESLGFEILDQTATPIKEEKECDSHQHSGSTSKVSKKPLFRRRNQTDDDTKQATCNVLEGVHVKEEDIVEEVISNTKGDHSDMEDLECLMVKRRSSRIKKRKTSPQSRGKLKRQRGVDFLDDVEDDASKDTTATVITCVECGYTLLEDINELEVQRRIPPFLKQFAGSSDPAVIYLEGQKMGDVLQTFSSVLDNGVTVDSRYVAEHSVILQYARCGVCGGQPGSRHVLGCTVIQTTADNTQYKTGQMWLFQHRVRAK